MDKEVVLQKLNQDRDIIIMKYIYKDKGIWAPHVSNVYFMVMISQFWINTLENFFVNYLIYVCICGEIYNNPRPHGKRLAERCYLDSLAQHKYPRSIQCIANVWQNTYMHESSHALPINGRVSSPG